MIRAENLTLGYDGAPVLTGVELEVLDGERWFLIGPNGSGKSTLLRAFLGLLPARSGTLRLAPELADHSAVGYVPQRCDWNTALPTTVREFVSLGFVGLDRSAAERQDALGWAFERVGIVPLELAPFASLSGGQRQRALVARALVRRPRLLILDEPTEELDVASEGALLETLLELNAQEGTTLVFVTHELELAERHATHVALFGGGCVRAGPRDAQLDPERLREAFGRHVSLGAPGQTHA